MYKIQTLFDTPAAGMGEPEVSAIPQDSRITLNEITLAYLNNIPIWILRDSSEMISRLHSFLYLGKYMDERKNVEIEFFDSVQDIIKRIKLEVND